MILVEPEYVSMSKWPGTARPGQLPPGPGWRTWGMVGDRGAGKSHAIIQLISSAIFNPSALRVRVGLVAPARVLPFTLDAIARESPESLRSIRCQTGIQTGIEVQRNGCSVTAFEAEQGPSAIRGHSFSLGVALDVDVWPEPTALELWDALRFATRVGDAQLVWCASTYSGHPTVEALQRQAAADCHLTVLTGGA